MHYRLQLEGDQIKTTATDWPRRSVICNRNGNTIEPSIRDTKGYLLQIIHIRGSNVPLYQ